MATCIRAEIMIVFAGYTKEMEQFLKMNPVLKSRVPNEFDFEDYTLEEAVEIGLKYLESQQCRFNEGDRYHRQHQEAVQADSGSHQVNDGSLQAQQRGWSKMFPMLPKFRTGLRKFPQTPRKS